MRLSQLRIVAQRGSSSTDSLPPPVLAEAADDGAPARGAGPDDGGPARRRPVIGEGGDEARARAKTAREELAGLAIAVVNTILHVVCTVVILKSGLWH